MADDEERALEQELELQLEEQKDALHSLTHALSSDPSNSELLSVHEELVQAIKDAEEGLLHLKRARLLREIDASFHGPKKESDADVEAEPLDPTEIKAEPLADEDYSVGSKCRFRNNDGRWYSGLIVGLEGSYSAKICFRAPTSENMVMCKFFLQQRCRFGSSCRLSHGIDIPISSLKKYTPMKWNASLAGSSIWALADSKAGLWKEAELESWDEKLNVGHIVFRDDGSSAMLGPENIELSVHAEVSDEESYSGSEDSDSSDSEDEGAQGLGFVESTSMQHGVQTETTLFAKWENHTRGIASRMMANMGYREGMGLGASGQGMVVPIPVKVLPKRQSLEHALENQKSENEDKKGKKRSRGGKRKREKKFAAASRAAKEEEESRPDVFSLINTQLAVHGEAMNNNAVKRQQSKTTKGEGKKEDRRALVAYDDEIKELRIRAQKLEDMMQRNRNEKPVYEAAMRKLNETHKALANAEAAHASASNAVHSKEKEKRWLKF